MNAGVRMGRAHENALQGIDIDVGHEPATAEQKAAILDSAKRRTDALLMGGYCSFSRMYL